MVLRTIAIPLLGLTVLYASSVSAEKYFDGYPELSHKTKRPIEPELERLTNQPPISWEIYKRQERTLLEQVVNYSISGELGGISFYYSVSNLRGADPCIIGVYLGGPHEAKLVRIFDLRPLISTSFKMDLIDKAILYFEDEKGVFLDSWYKNQPPERLEKAWMLAFKECPSKKKLPF